MAPYSPTLSVMIKTAEKAARSLVRDFGEVENLQVQAKGPQDFVSKADLRAEEIIYEELLYARGDYAFQMEEGGLKNQGKSEFTWIIDPLDGTHNFLYGIPHWCISIGLKKGDELIAGVVYDPIKDEMFRAEKGQGAFMNRTRLRVSGRKNIQQASIGYVSTRKDDPEYIEGNERIRAHKPQNQRSFGAAALDLCYVAAGRFDWFWYRGLNAWDIAAGAVIVQEAKGIIQDWQGKQNFLEKGEVIASTPNLFHPIKKLALPPKSTKKIA